MHREIQDKWIAALKSGKYRQHWPYLRRVAFEGDGFRYSAFGVLCDVVEMPVKEDYYGITGYDFSDGINYTDIPDNIKTELGLTQRQYDAVYTQCSIGKTFEDIATLIENNFHE